MPQSMPSEIVVFSHIDELLANSDTCVPDVAEAVGLLRKERIPLVFCSANTRAQIELVQQDFRICHPFIAENGGAVFIPRDYFEVHVPHARVVAGYHAIEFGRPYTEIVQALRRTTRRLQIGIVGFYDMSIDEVAADCDLSLLQARLAKLREYDEPFRLVEYHPTARKRLARALSAMDIGCRSQGRYEHAGSPLDVSVGMDLLTVLYRRALGSVLSVGLGESVDDVALLRQVDMPVVLAGDDTTARRVAALVPNAHIARVREVGWIGAIEAIVEVARRRQRTAATAIDVSWHARRH